MRSIRFSPRAALGALTFLAFRASGCVDNFEIGRDALGSNAGGEGGELGGSGGAPDAGGGPATGGTGGCTPVKCQGKGPYACGDCLDNDDDGATDSADAACTGPCDDTEDSFFGGIPGQNNAPCNQDCYFDSNSGFGDDQCYWTHECDDHSIGPDYPPSGDASCAYNASATVPGTDASCGELFRFQSDRCVLELCRPVVPNGCDCFGCCQLDGRSNRYVFIGSTVDGQPSCNESTISDPSACRPCTPVLSCFNSCEPCEHCVGGTLPDPSCVGGDAGGPGVSERCDPGVTPCGQVGEPECPAEEYCITGCCVVVLK
jgi:hypothetical protein